MKYLSDNLSQYVPFILLAIYLVFLAFIYVITQNNFYIREDYYFFGYFQAKVNNPNLPFPFMDNITFNPLFYIPSFYLYQFFGVANPSIWYVFVNLFHVVNSFLLYKILTLYFRTHFKYKSFLLIFIPTLFLVFAGFHQNIFLINAGPHVQVLSFMLGSLFCYWQFFIKSPKIISLFFALFFMLLAFFTLDSAVLLPCYFFLDLLFWRQSQFKTCKPLRYFYISIPIITFSILVFRFSVLSLKSDYGPFFMVLSQKISWQTMFDFVFFSFQSSFFKLFFPAFSQFPFWCQILFAQFISILLAYVLFRSSKQLRKSIFFILSCITISFMLFLPMTFSRELSPRYSYYPAFFFMFLMFIFFQFLSQKNVKLTFLLAILLLSLNMVALFLGNKTYYIPYGQAFKHYVLTGQKKISINVQFLGINKSYVVWKWVFDAINHYKEQQKFMKQKYHLQ